MVRLFGEDPASLKGFTKGPGDPRRHLDDHADHETAPSNLLDVRGVDLPQAIHEPGAQLVGPLRHPSSRIT